MSIKKLLKPNFFLAGFIFFCQSLCLGGPSLSTTSESFKFHLLSEPHSTDPALLRGSSARYLFTNLYRTLYIFDDNKGLIADGAKRCRWLSELKLKCQLKKNFFSDGSPILAQHYVASFRHLMSPQIKSLKTKLLFYLKNAPEILSSTKKPNSLGIIATKKYELLFVFHKKDAEFLYKLTSPVLSPLKSKNFYTYKKASQLITSGPYKIASWKRNRQIILTPNPFYKNANARPKVLIRFVEAPVTATRLYQSGHLNFLRTLQTSLIPKYKKKKSFFTLPLARFDYMGFSKKLKSQPDLKIALSHSLNFAELQRIYHSLGVPGCPGLSKKLVDQNTCYNFDLNKARKHFAKLPKEIREKRWKIAYSKLGGEDLKRGIEWFAHQWKKHLGLKTEIIAIESGMLLQTLRLKTPDIFRKALFLDRPTCLSALEQFQKGHPSNYIGYNNPQYEKILKKMEHSTKKTSKKLCTKAIQTLLKDYVLIPLGEVQYAMLSDNKFTGFRLNSLEQLDLRNLRHNTPASQ